MSTTTESTSNVTLAGELSLELTRYFAFTPERLFDAWLGEEWGEWLPPMGATGRVTAMEARPEGSFAVDMNMPDGRAIEICGKYLEAVRTNLL